MEFHKKLIGNEDERAVSPVIGVILMVAITVILAAVIAAFVLDMGSSLGDSGPNSQLSMGMDGSDTVAISHNGGDRFDGNDVIIVIRNADTNANIVTLTPEDNFETDDVDGYDETDDELVANLNSGNLHGETVSTGDTITIEEDIAESSDSIFDDDVTVQVVHSSSDNIIGESTL